jgi:hypothetical protein
MLIIIIILILSFLSGVSNAVIETVRNHPQRSIFPQTYWWNLGMESWKNKYVDRDALKPRTKTLVQFTDAIHFFKVLEIIFSFIPIFFLLTWEQPLHNLLPIGITLLVFIIRNLGFSIFYNKIFLK